MNYVIINFQSQNTTITVTDYDNTSDNSHDSASGNNTTNSSKPSDDECDNLSICTLHNTFFACYGIIILLHYVKCPCTRLYKIVHRWKHHLQLIIHTILATQK